MKFAYNQHHATCNFRKTIDSWYQNCCMIVLNLSQIISGSAVCIAIFIYIQGGFETKRKISFKKMFNSRGPKIDPCGTFVVILSHLLKVLVTYTLTEPVLNPYLPFLTWKLIIHHGLICRRPCQIMKITQIHSPPSDIFSAFLICNSSNIVY